VLQEEGAMFIFVFCGVFTLMLLVILVLPKEIAAGCFGPLGRRHPTASRRVDLVCSLRRAIVPDIRGFEFGEGGRTSSLQLPAFNKE
ncbi:hypothetical protein PRIPAC_95336, partial [Pristionchus pacificus]|uniref:Uncharacterized protein n=1 Tax=Pristionchus pacificus TaxID=54126 RepID=A0A2A6CH29_PRIPA